MTVKKGDLHVHKMDGPGLRDAGNFERNRTLLFRENDEVHYIGGAEVLPPPLDAGEEACASGCLPQMRRRRRGEN